MSMNERDRVTEGLYNTCLCLLLVQTPAVERVALDGTEDLGAQVGIALFQFDKQLLDFLALGGAVGGAGVGDNGQSQPVDRVSDIALLDIQQGTKLRHICAVKVGDGLEAADAPLHQKIHHQRFHRVVVVVSQRDLLDAKAVQLGAERAAAHLGAQGAGVFLLAAQKYDLIGGDKDDVIGDFQFFAQLFDGAKVHARNAGINGDRHQIEPPGVEAAQVRQRRQQQHGVLAAADTDGDGIAILDHMIVLHTAADKGQNMLHQNDPPGI